MQRSAPSARHVRSASSACGGPIVIAITSPSFTSLSFAACITAAASNGLSRSGTPSRFSCFVPWSNSIESARGTCLTKQTIFTCGSLGECTDRPTDSEPRNWVGRPHEQSSYGLSAAPPSRRLSCMLAALYDIHGSLPALEAVLADAEAEGADSYLLGGDYGAWGPHPLECLELLRALPQTTWIRGNGERWTRAPPLDRPEVVEALRERESGYGSEEGWLYSLQAQCELNGVLYVHGSPLSDVDSFAADPDDERDVWMLDGVRDQTVVFGHSHLQFRRAGPNGTTLINPGSVGMPLDGDVRAAYALRHDDGEFVFRRVEYDTERVAQAWEELGGTFGKFAAERTRKGSD